MRDKHFQKLTKFSNAKDLSEQVTVNSVNGNPQWHFVLSLTNAIIDHIIHNSFVLVMLFSLDFAPTALNVPLDALVDQYLSKLILSVLDIELSSGLQGILKSIVVVVEVEVEFGKQESDNGLVRKFLVLVQLVTTSTKEYIMSKSLAMSIQCKVM